MKIGKPLQITGGEKRRARFVGTAMAALLSISLVVSLQPCCELFASLFEQPGDALAGVSVKADHEHGSTLPVSGKLQDYCGHGASSGADLAKVVPVVPSNASSSHAGGALAVSVTPIFFAATRAVLPSAYHPSPPPFRVYLRFLHLLM